MILAFESLLPSFLLILFGFSLSRSPLLPAALWEGVERLNYYVLFPALLFVTLARADLASAPIGPMAGAMVLAILLVAGGMLASRRWWMSLPDVDGRAYSSHFQGAIRWQTSVALALAATLYGREGLALGAIGVAAMIPLLNLLSVAVVASYGASTPPSRRALAQELARNPLILSVLAGAALNASGVQLYGPVVETVDLLGRGALGVGLLLVGAGLAPATLRLRLDIGLVVAVKLVLMPILMIGLATLFGVEGVALGVVAISSAVPTASNAYLLARRLGGDAPLMSAIITVQTVVAFATLPTTLWLIGAT
ncbi:putative permease [Methylopila capsulata]|uniref:Permease n=1 Tax=Methylopila capsulata TaxID=61654 RepID=A0A9W6MRE6_9HYPH|nr:AEC family transporter [Methylopila capsulata]MBM7849877.1 putative permease [Methylopila capsulata]GLK55167.1 transporter [Methylopila capsulata]